MRFLILLCLVAAPVFAQDLAGVDASGEWVITHQKPFGLWDSVCDRREAGALTQERCYLRYVDVYSPRPEFGAMFLLITGEGVEFRMERGIRFSRNGFRAERGGSLIWQETRRDCLNGRECYMTGSRARAFLDTISGGGALRFTFRDRSGNPRDLSWDLAPVAAALADYRAEARLRGLPAA